VGLFHRNSTNQKLDAIEAELRELKRRFLQMEQEWDATSSRVSKTLRRIARAEQAADKEELIEKLDAAPALPLTTISASPERMEKIRKQLAEKGRA
jgi:outer membrane murein-binding lipoprotein Lpp